MEYIKICFEILSQKNVVKFMDPKGGLANFSKGGVGPTRGGSFVRRGLDPLWTLWFLPPFRKDRNSYGGGVMIFVRDSIPVKVLDTTLPNENESIFLELNLKNNKWLLMGAYRPPSQCSKLYYSQIN